MSYRTNLVIVLILMVSFVVNVFNIYGWFHGHVSSTAELIASISVVILWFVSSLYMGYKFDGIFFIFILIYWGLGTLLSGIAFILNLIHIDFGLIISVIVCFMYTGQLYGIGYEFSHDIHFNPEVGIALVAFVCVLSLVGFFIGIIIKKKLPLNRV